MGIDFTTVFHLNKDIEVRSTSGQKSSGAEMFADHPLDMI